MAEAATAGQGTEATTGQTTGTGAAAAPAATLAGAGQTPVTRSDGVFDWRMGLPADLREDKTVQNFKGDFNDVVKTMVHQQRMLGSSVQIPKTDAPQEDWGKFYEKLGRPGDAAGYTYDKATHLPEGVDGLNPDFERDFRVVCHDAGLTEQQFQKLVHFTGVTVKQAQNVEAARLSQMKQDGMKFLEREFGANARPMQQRATSVLASMAQGLFTSPENGQMLIEEFQESDLAYNPRMLAWIAEVGARLGEGIMYENDVNQVSIMGVDTMQTEYQKLMEKKVLKTNEFTPNDQKQLDRLGEAINRAEAQQGRVSRVA